MRAPYVPTRCDSARETAGSLSDARSPRCSLFDPFDRLGPGKLGTSGAGWSLVLSLSKHEPSIQIGERAGGQRLVALLLAFRRLLQRCHDPERDIRRLV